MYGKVMAIRLMTRIKIRRGDAGVGLLELALILPFVLMVFCAGIEFSRAMSTYSRLNMLVREVARAGYSECAQIASPDYEISMNAEVLTCLTNVVTATANVPEEILPGVKIAVSMYKWDPLYVSVDPHMPPYERTRPIAKFSLPADFTGRFSESSFQPGPPQPGPRSSRNALLENEKTLVYGEVEYSYQPIVPFIAQLFGFGISRTFYVATSF